MYRLHNNPILYPHQIKLLSLFFTSPFAKPFFLTGGTALSAFYLAHRESQDLVTDVDKFKTLPKMRITFDKGAFYNSISVFPVSYC